MHSTYIYVKTGWFSLDPEGSEDHLHVHAMYMYMYSSVHVVELPLAAFLAAERIY